MGKRNNMARNYCVIPFAYAGEMKMLNDAEFGRLIRALLRYAEDGEPVELTGNERFFAERVMLEEDRHQKSYESTCAMRSAAGKAGAEARWGRPRPEADGKHGYL